MVDEIKPYTPIVQSDEELELERQEAVQQMLEEGVFPVEQVGPLIAQVSTSFDSLRAQVAQLLVGSNDHKLRLEMLEAAMLARQYFAIARQPYPVNTQEVMALNAPTVIDLVVPISVPGLYKVALDYNWNSSMPSVYCISWLEKNHVMEGGIHRQKSQSEGGHDEEYLMYRNYHIELDEGENNLRYRVMTGIDPVYDLQPGELIEASIEDAVLVLTKAGVG